MANEKETRKDEFLREFIKNTKEDFGENVDFDENALKDFASLVFDTENS